MDAALHPVSPGFIHLSALRACLNLLMDADLHLV